MKNVNEFLDAVKKVTGSDNKTAQLLGHERQLISGWRRLWSFPTNSQIALMCDKTGLDMKQAIFAVEASREEKNGTGDYWKKKLAKLGGIAASIFFAVTLIVTPTPSQAAPLLDRVMSVCILCQMTRISVRWVKELALRLIKQISVLGVPVGRIAQMTA